MYLGTQKISEIRETDKLTPLGSPVKEVFFMSPLDLTHEAIDEVREKIDAIVKGEPESEERTAKLSELDKEEVALSQRQLTDSDEGESAYVTDRTLGKFQTEAPDPEYYTKRKHLIVSELLQLMSEWGVQEIELGQIFQNLQDSLNQNKNAAFEKKMGRTVKNLNLLDYHYAITGTDREDA